MRAKEFTINIPINIKMDDDQPQIVAAQPAAAPAAAPQPAQEPVDDNVGTFIPPLQQKIELLKKSWVKLTDTPPILEARHHWPLDWLLLFFLRWLFRLARDRTRI